MAAQKKAKTQVSKALIGAGSNPDRMLRVCEANAVAAMSANRPDIRSVARSALLDRASAFLPQLKAANRELVGTLQREGAAVVDIETLESGEGEAGHIAMDLTCGVVDLNDEAAVAAAEAVSGKGVTVHEQQLAEEETTDDEQDTTRVELLLGGSKKESVRGESAGSQEGAWETSSRRKRKKLIEEVEWR